MTSNYQALARFYSNVIVTLRAVREQLFMFSRKARFFFFFDSTIRLTPQTQPRQAGAYEPNLTQYSTARTNERGNDPRVSRVLSVHAIATALYPVFLTRTAIENLKESFAVLNDLDFDQIKSGHCIAPFPIANAYFCHHKTVTAISSQSFVVPYSPVFRTIQQYDNNNSREPRNCLVTTVYSVCRPWLSADTSQWYYVFEKAYESIFPSSSLSSAFQVFFLRSLLILITFLITEYMLNDPLRRL